MGKSTRCCAVALLLLACQRVTANESSQGCAALFSQCGGNGYTGPTCCQGGATCAALADNPFFKQCQMINHNAGAATLSQAISSETEATNAAGDECVPAFGQCGGIGYHGHTCCQAGLTCVAGANNPFYSQCKPSPVAAADGVLEVAPLTVTTPGAVCYHTHEGYAAVCDECLVKLNGEPFQSVATVGACKRTCSDLGWGACRSVTFAAGRCYLYNAQVEGMGAHGYREEAGATLASQCAPPAALAQFPDNPVANAGVNWGKLCQGAAKYEVIPNQLPSCGKACKLPSGADLQVKTASECAAACLAKPGCKCAYFQKNGWCDLHSAGCQDPDNGVRYNAMRTTDAIHPCRERDAQAWPGAMDDYDTSVDWHGLWDDFCESDVPTFVIPDQESFCGPDCHLRGTQTQRVDSVTACAGLCTQHPECRSAFHASDGRCSLMRTSWREALAFDTRGTSLGVQEAIAMCRKPSAQ